MKIHGAANRLAGRATLILALCLQPPAQAQMALEREQYVSQTVSVTTYLNGGIGKDEAATMRRIAGGFPLRLAFSERQDDEFLADIPVFIADARGNPIFALPKAGPMLFVMLPDGRYRVSARFRGLTESHWVTIAAKSPQDVFFHWKGSDPQ